MCESRGGRTCLRQVLRNFLTTVKDLLLGMGWGERVALKNFCRQGREENWETDRTSLLTWWNFLPTPDNCVDRVLVIGTANASAHELPRVFDDVVSATRMAMIPTVGGLAQRVFRILSYSKLLLEEGDEAPPPRRVREPRRLRSRKRGNPSTSELRTST